MMLFIEYQHYCLFNVSRADKAVLSSSGFQADVKALQKVLKSRHLGSEILPLLHFFVKMKTLLIEVFSFVCPAGLSASA